MAPPPPLIDDVTAEFLLRLPPDEPEHLIRAALVCKTWLRIICDPGFRRLYRDFHGAPPLLGLLHRLMVLQGDPPARFASTTSMPGLDGRHTRPLDCRHGRVLIHTLPGFLVSDPVNGDRHCLPPEPKEMDWLIYSAAVLCATHACDHIDCHGGLFRVVFVATHERKNIILASVYSSEMGAWSVPVCLGNHLYMWSRKVDTEEAAEWVQYRVIELEKTVPVANPDKKPFVVGFAEGVGVIFVSSGVGLFTIQLSSGQVKKVYEPGEYFIVLPYMSFYLPKTGNGGGNEATDLRHNT